MYLLFLDESGIPGEDGIFALGGVAIRADRWAEVKERFEYYGAPGELRIMKEISIEDGNDLKHQIPKSLRVPPPPARVEVEEEKSVEGFEPVPEKAEHDANELDVNTKNPLDNAESSEDFQVEMNLPMQTSDSFYLVHGPRPDYPLGATESERRTPVIAVKVGIFVGPDGHVSDVMILANDGGRAFEDAVRDVLREWKFAWLKEPGAGRWLQFTIRFKSPYFTPGR